MTLTALSNDVRSMLSASSHVNNYKTAIAELVYNALDAESTSIAIRVHIQENRLQVIDNGCGIIKNDFDALGKRYMTSKVTNIGTLKSMPKYYGFRGEFIANLIEISQSVNIISRYKDGEETWALTFYESKRKKLVKMTTRPSKGTTVDVKGFLYNLKIQKRAIDPINELQNIKTFLEQLSIVHDEISLSLRDDSKNEIIFKIHKKRNIYQTLSSLFGINQSDVQELQIEKNQYKVKGYIGKADNNIEKYWIYLNGKLLQSFSKLHKISNEYLRKYLRLTDNTKRSKYKKNCDEENVFKSNIPFYIILIVCPYNDYDISFTLRQSLVEFKKWDQIKMILEKLIKFYVGDIKLKEVKRSDQNNILQSKGDNKDTRNQIKKIVDKILGSNTKKIRESQLHNGIKGKLVKRKKRNKNKDINSVKLQPTLPKITDLQAENIGVEKRNEKKDEHLFTSKDRQKNEKYKTFLPTNTLEYITQENVQVENSVKCNQKVKKFVQPCKAKNYKKKKNKHEAKNNNKSEAKLLLKPQKNTSHKINLKMKRNKYQKSDCFQFIKDTDTIPKRSKIVAEKVTAFLNNNFNYNTVEEFSHKPNNKEPVRKKKHSNYMNKIYKYKYPTDLASNQNQHITNYARHKIKTRTTSTLKTTYDLVKTILESRCIQEQTDNMHCGRKSSVDVRRYSDVDDRNMYLNRIITSQYCSSYRKEQQSTYDEMENVREAPKWTCDSINKQQYSNSINIDRQFSAKETYKYYKTPMDLSCRSLRYNDLLEHYTQINPSSYCSNVQTVVTLTYQSHNYDNPQNMYHENTQNMYRENTQGYNVMNQNKSCSAGKVKRARYITKQSRDNFMPVHNKYEYKSYVKNKYRGTITKKVEFYNKNIQQMKDKSYTIEFTTSNDINCSFNKESISRVRGPELCTSDIEGNESFLRQSYSPNYQLSAAFGNTYTVLTGRTTSSQVNAQCESVNVIPDRDCSSNSEHSLNINRNNDNMEMEVNNRESNENQDNCNGDIIIPSKSDETINHDINMDDDIHPMNFCETVFNENRSIEKEFAFSFHGINKSKDSLYNYKENCNSDNENNQIRHTIPNTNMTENVSHHFGNTLNSNNLNIIHEITQNPVTSAGNHEETNNMQKSQSLKERNTKDDNFNFKDRLRFLPKGMSQIFEKGGSKTVYNYNLDEEYYGDDIYNDFANDIEMQTEIYGPVVQNVDDLATNDIHKFKTKVQKENTCLVFNEKSLKAALVLNQVDCKFIAAIMKGGGQGLESTVDYLILFDQHAVHERIRLEKNLEDYITEDVWISVPLDNVTLKMSKDEILYLHNYKDKFNQLGLQWSFSDNNEVAISSIPKAILGNNPREVEKVMKAVQNLIMEEINVIKLQKGCISLYPKAIMDLVFSEACRYAIKFGDKLSKAACVNLIQELANCKTPFQCAHGRPVMAVLLDIKSTNHDYNIKMETLSLFKRKVKQ